MTSPREFFEAERDKRLQQLTDAGIEQDMAFEIASHCALETVRKKIMAAFPLMNADDYQSSPNVYGE